jgi:hypothetical protein
MSPYLLVYGKEAKIMISLDLNALISMVNNKDIKYHSPIHRRINQLLKLEEERSKALNLTCKRKNIINIYFDQRTIVKKFHKGELVLLWNKAMEKSSMHTNFEEL